MLLTASVNPRVGFPTGLRYGFGFGLPTAEGGTSLSADGHVVDLQQRARLLVSERFSILLPVAIRLAHGCCKLPIAQVVFPYTSHTYF